MRNSNFEFGDIRSQFKEDIQMIVNEFQHSFDDLVDQLLSLHDFALGNGLSQNEWMELINEIDPQIGRKISFAKLAA